MAKKIYSRSKIKEKILRTVEDFAQPIISTLTPKGTNVIYQTDNRSLYVTNDGVTIAKQIEFEDPVENAIAQMIKHSALKTNYDVGDGTTTSILLTRELIKEGFKLLDNGWNPMILKRELLKAGSIIVSEIERRAKKIKTQEDLYHIALIASNNDQEIASNVVKALKYAGKEGIVLIEENPKDNTEIKVEEGFFLESGMFSPHFANVPGKFLAEYREVKVLVTDKRIYYPEEAISILKCLADKGIRDVVVIAQDFIGQAPNVFIANHVRRKMNVLLIKDEKGKNLEDLAAYLGTSVVSDKKGELTTKIKIENFGTAKKVVADAKRTLVVAPPNPIAKDRIKAIKEELKEVKDDKEKKELEKRLARMTRGTITLYVGGKTVPEQRERMFRYEDAINATRSAKDKGWVVGGGVCLYQAFREAERKGFASRVIGGFPVAEEIDRDIIQVIKKACLAPLAQIATNCNLHLPTLISKVGEKENWGYNALTDKYENLLEAGVIEPVEVVKQAFQNALSIASVILSSNFLIVEEDEREETSSKTKE